MQSIISFNRYTHNNQFLKFRVCIIISMYTDYKINQKLLENFLKINNFVIAINLNHNFLRKNCIQFIKI
jgi:hypothetical protein